MFVVMFFNQIFAQHRRNIVRTQVSERGFDACDALNILKFFLHQISCISKTPKETIIQDQAHPFTDERLPVDVCFAGTKLHHQTVLTAFNVRQSSNRLH